MAKNTLALFRQPPYGSALAREGLEAVLAMAAMDQSPQLLFLGDGVFQLLGIQAPDAIGQKSLQRNLRALPMFGVERIHVCRRSLTERDIDTGEISIPGLEIELIDDSAGFIAACDTVLSF